MYYETVQTRIRQLNHRGVNGKFQMLRGKEISKQYVEFSTVRGHLVIRFKGTYLALIIRYQDISEFAINGFDFKWIGIKTKKRGISCFYKRGG